MQRERTRRKSRSYDGVELTSRKLSDLLPLVTSKLGAVIEGRSEAIIAAWPSLVGEKIALFSEAVSFNEGALTVRVRSSTLYSLLVQQEKKRLLGALRERFPGATIKTILFRMG